MFHAALFGLVTVFLLSQIRAGLSATVATFAALNVTQQLWGWPLLTTRRFLCSPCICFNAISLFQSRWTFATHSQIHVRQHDLRLSLVKELISALVSLSCFAVPDGRRCYGSYGIRGRVLFQSTSYFVEEFSGSVGSSFVAGDSTVRRGPVS